MGLATYPIDERDISFVLFDQLGVEQLFQYEAFQSISRDESEMVLKEACRFAVNDIWPTFPVSDRMGCSFESGKVKVPECFHGIYETYKESGWIGLTASEEFGGAGMPASIGVAVAEIFCGANQAFSHYPGLTRGVARLIERHGSDWMRDQVVRRLFNWEWSGTMCLTEPQAGSSVGDIRTTAAASGNSDEYLISGSKLFITAGEHDLTPNIIHLVLARTENAPQGIKGLSLFVVPKIWIEPDGTEGGLNDVICSGIEEKMGIHGSSTCTLNYGENGSCRGLLLGGEGDGIRIMFDMMNEARIGTGLQGLSAAAVSYHLALGYAKERIQGVELKNIRDFNAPRVPIIEHPDVKRMLFRMKASVEGMRVLLYKAANCADLALSHPDGEARDRANKLLELLTPICKAYCSDQGFIVTVSAMQTYGGYGYTKEYPVEQLLRDSKISSIYEGTNGIQALDLIGRKLPKNSGEYFMILMKEIESLIESCGEHPVAGSLAGILEKEVARVRTVTGVFARSGFEGDIDFPAMNAVPYLKMLGNLVIGWLFLEQTMVAHDRLSEMMFEMGVDSIPGRDRLVAENESARYYNNKMVTAGYFIRNMLSENMGIAESILEGNRDILVAGL